MNTHTNRANKEMLFELLDSVSVSLTLALKQCAEYQQYTQYTIHLSKHIQRHTYIHAICNKYNEICDSVEATVRKRCKYTRQTKLLGYCKCVLCVNVDSKQLFIQYSIIRSSSIYLPVLSQTHNKSEKKTRSRRRKKKSAITHKIKDGRFIFIKLSGIKRRHFN